MKDQLIDIYQQVIKLEPKNVLEYTKKDLILNEISYHLGKIDEDTYKTQRFLKETALKVYKSLWIGPEYDNLSEELKKLN